VLAPKSIGVIHAALGRRFPANLEDAPLARDDVDALGRVVFVRLEPPTMEGLLADGDHRAARLLLASRYGISWPGTESRLPCIVIANRHGPECRGLDIATVVPLIEATDQQGSFSGNPQVAIPGTESSLWALTQCLLSVSSNDFQNDPRMSLTSGNLKSWFATPGELRAVVTDVRQWLGLDQNV
jgi:hypothetical protein